MIHLSRRIKERGRIRRKDTETFLNKSILSIYSYSLVLRYYMYVDKKKDTICIP